MKALKPVLALAALAACSPSLSYTPVKSGPDQANSLRFSLQAPAILLADASLEIKKSNGDIVKPQDSCRGVTEKDVYKCLENVVPVVSSVAEDDGGRWLAIPNNSFPRWIFGTTKIGGTPVEGSEFLYKQVTINYIDNTKNIIATAGAGAATGVSIGGLAGGLAGAGVGAIIGAAENKMTFRPPVPFKEKICQEDREIIDLEKLEEIGNQPHIGLPIIILPKNLPDIRNTITSKNLYAADPDPALHAVYPNSPTSVCWHLVPNMLSTSSSTASLSLAQLGGAVPVEPRKPEKGDGWFYRIVFVHSDDTPDETGNAPTAEDALSGKSPDKQIEGNMFPASLCRPGAILQIIWWKNLRDFKFNYQVATRSYKLGTLPDPGLIQKVSLPDNGVINFRKQCGVSSTNGSAPADIKGDWDALNNAINNYKTKEKDYITVHKKTNF
ncbi:hypothetical protein [Rhodovastum atsumiense]|uniref:Lipoprotein n=1 Tax=Rhodovastum atsumiense TaxID=504468 RepID=A0A5M6IQ14_9PROT|nr:hypothetical protein [Rhodovastum atsumiense]KAA5609575.1 hypothetical protein F1189_23410 [Rhodovastum atsumiense]